MLHSKIWDTKQLEGLTIILLLDILVMEKVREDRVKSTKNDVSAGYGNEF